MRPRTRNATSVDVTVFACVMVDPPDSTSWKDDSGWMKVKRKRTRGGVTKNIPEEGKAKEHQRSD